MSTQNYLPTDFVVNGLFSDPTYFEQTPSIGSHVQEPPTQSTAIDTLHAHTDNLVLERYCTYRIVQAAYDAIRCTMPLWQFAQRTNKVGAEGCDLLWAYILSGTAIERAHRYDCPSPLLATLEQFHADLRDHNLDMAPFLTYALSRIHVIGEGITRKGRKFGSLLGRLDLADSLSTLYPTDASVDFYDAPELRTTSPTFRREIAAHFFDIEHGLTENRSANFLVQELGSLLSEYANLGKPFLVRSACIDAEYDLTTVHLSPEERLQDVEHLRRRCVYFLLADSCAKAYQRLQAAIGIQSDGAATTVDWQRLDRQLLADIYCCIVADHQIRLIGSELKALCDPQTTNSAAND